MWDSRHAWHRCKPRPCCIAPLACLVLCLFGRQAAAQTWVGGIDSNWGNGGNWSNNSVPGNASNITLSGNPANLPTLPAGSTTLHSVTYDSTAVNFNLGTPGGGQTLVL